MTLTINKTIGFIVLFVSLVMKIFINIIIKSDMMLSLNE